MPGSLISATIRLLQAMIVWSFLGSAAAAADPMKDGRAWSEAFLDGEITSIWPQMDARMQEALGSKEALRQVHETLQSKFGEEAEVLDEKVTEQDGYSVYLRTARWTEAAAPLVMQWTFDRQGMIAGFFVRPKPVAVESQFLDYQTKAELRLPFEGQWFVYWGGRTIEQNYHAADRAQRFAVDLLVMKDGASHSGDPADLESYYCWGKPILAPAAGRVVAAVEDLPDQAIGSSNPAHPAGNHVVIDFGNGEFGFLAHLRNGSVTVETGDKVEPGQEIARCGNSGNTSEPHLHFHLQTTPDLQEGEGLPAQFVSYIADGRPVERGELVKGQTVSPVGD